MGRTYTTYFNLSKPDYGAAGADWYSWLNANLDAIDAQLAKNPQLATAVGATKDRRYLAGMPSNVALTTGAPSANQLRAFPFVTELARTVDRIGINVTTLAAGLARVGIYADDGSLYPGSLVLDAGWLDVSATGVKEATISQALSANTLYWLALVGNVAPTLRCLDITACLALLGLDSGYGTVQGVGWVAALTYAALPATFTAGGTVITAAPIPAIGLRFSV